MSKTNKQTEFEDKFRDFFYEYNVMNSINRDFRDELQLRFNIDIYGDDFFVGVSATHMISRHGIVITIKGSRMIDIISYQFDSLSKIYKRLDAFLEHFKKSFLEVRDNSRKL